MDAKELEKKFGYSEAELDAMAKPFEDGVWPKGHTKLVGRPKLADEDIKNVSIKMPASELEQIDRSAKKAGVSRSQFIRDACRSTVAATL